MGNSEFDLSESGGHGRCMMKETKQEKTKRGWFMLEQGATQVTTTDSVRDSIHATTSIKKKEKCEPQPGVRELQKASSGHQVVSCGLWPRQMAQKWRP